MKILHLYTDLKIPCGITKTIHYMVRFRQADSQHWVYSKSNSVPELFNGYCENTFISTTKSTNIFSLIADVYNIIKVVKKNDIDILHSHHRYFDLAAYFTSKILKIPTICTVQSKVTGRKIFSYKSDKLVCVGSAIKKHLTGYFGVNPGKITVIHNFVVPEDFQYSVDRVTLRKNLTLPEVSNLFLFVGRLHKEKAVDILIKAFSELIKKNQDCFLLFIGDGTEKSFLETEILKNSIPAKIIKPQLDIFNYYLLADFVVLPSRVDPFPLVVLETGFACKPFIGTNVDGIAEMIEPGIHGILTEPENVEELSNAMETAVENKAGCIKMAECFNRKVLSEFTVEKVLPEYYKLYASMMKN